MMELNSDEFIDSKLRPMTSNEIYVDQSPKFWVNVKLSFFTLISGRKWIIFLLICMFPILISLLSRSELLGNPNSRAAFVDLFIGLFYLLLFGWGALVISLPLSADEISDNMMDLYIVRPIRRDVFWFSRWLVNFIGLFLLNTIIALIYYVYFHIVGDVENIFSNLDVFFAAVGFMFFASLTYSGLYLFVSSLGDKGFSLGVFLAIFEPYFLSLLFLGESRYIPRNNCLRIADVLFGDDFDLTSDFGFGNFPDALTTGWALMYTLVFTLLFMAVGAYYYRKREFN